MPLSYRTNLSRTRISRTNTTGSGPRRFWFWNWTQQVLVLVRLRYHLNSSQQGAAVSPLALSLRFRPISFWVATGCWFHSLEALKIPLKLSLKHKGVRLDQNRTRNY